MVRDDAPRFPFVVPLEKNVMYRFLWAVTDSPIPLNPQTLLHVNTLGLFVISACTTEFYGSTEFVLLLNVLHHLLGT